MKQKIKWYLIFFLLFAALGFLREFYFVNMNNILYIKYYQRPTFMPVPPILQPFLKLDYDRLYYLKYPATLLCALLYFIISWYTLKIITANKKVTRILLYAYAVLFILAAISMSYGYFVNNRLQDDEYTISRWLMGIVQSPIICLILLASEKLYSKQLPS